MPLFDKQHTSDLASYFKAIYEDEYVDSFEVTYRARMGLPAKETKGRSSPDSNFQEKCSELYAVLSETYDINNPSYVSSRAHRWRFIEDFIRLVLRDVQSDFKKEGIQTTDDFLLSNWLKITPPKDFSNECGQIAARMDWNLSNAAKIFDSLSFDDPPDPGNDDDYDEVVYYLGAQERKDYSDFMLCDAPFILSTLELFQAALNSQGGKDNTVMVLSSFTDGLHHLIEKELQLHPEAKKRFIAAIEKSNETLPEEEHISFPDMHQYFADLDRFGGNLPDGYQIPEQTIIRDNRMRIEAKKMWEDIDPDIKRDLATEEMIIPANAYNPL